NAERRTQNAEPRTNEEPGTRNAEPDVDRDFSQEPREDLRGRRGRGARASGREPRGAARRVPGRDRPLRLRQVDIHAHRWLPGSADIGPVLSRWPGRVADVEGRAGRGA